MINLLRRKVHPSNTYYNRKKKLIPLLLGLSGICAAFSTWSNFFLLNILAALFMPYYIAFSAAAAAAVFFDLLKVKLLNELGADYYDPPTEAGGTNFLDPVTLGLTILIVIVSFSCSWLGTSYRAEAATTATTAAAVDSLLIAEQPTVDLSSLAEVRPATTRAERRNARETANLLEAATAAQAATAAATARRDSLIQQKAKTQNTSTLKTQNGFKALLIVSDIFLFLFCFSIQRIKATRPKNAPPTPPITAGASTLNVNSINPDYGNTDEEIKKLRQQYAEARSTYERTGSQAAEQRMQDKLSLLLELGGTPPQRRRRS